MPDTAVYTVPDISCEHCSAAVTQELSAVAGVQSVHVDLQSKRVSITGTQLQDSSLRAAIAEAGYEAS